MNDPLKTVILETPRLRLRPLEMSDAPRIHLLASEYDIAATTLSIPHPYEKGMAEEFIRKHAEATAKRESYVFAIVLRSTGELIGTAGLSPQLDHGRAEIGYWIGKEYWNNGYCTEAVRRILAFGFDELGLNRIFAFYFAQNGASGRVMEKCGMREEGVLRQHTLKWDRYVDLVLYAIVRSDYESLRAVDATRTREVILPA